MRAPWQEGETYQGEFLNGLSCFLSPLLPRPRPLIPLPLRITCAATSGLPLLYAPRVSALRARALAYDMAY